MTLRHFSLYTGNTNAGADTNLAVSNFYIDSARGTDSQIAADLIAWAQYAIPASGTYVKSVDAGVAGGSGQLPIPWPAAAYAVLAAADLNLAALVGYSDVFGANALAVAGTGAVVARHTATPGRSGRGRLTTPWMNAASVTAIGTLSGSQQAVVLTGYNTYVLQSDGNHYITGLLGPLPVTFVTVTTTLGRVRSRRS